LGVYKSVFASAAERSNFAKLRRQWGDSYDLWHNVPFLNIFTREPLFDFDAFPPVRATISDRDWQRLKKTSVDYVLCEKPSSKPVVGVDFDGMQRGVNIGREYRPGTEEDDQWRSKIMNLKLRVAHGSFFPYFIVASDHFADISPRLRLTIVDGVIGEVLAKQAARSRLSRPIEVADMGLSEDYCASLDLES